MWHAWQGQPHVPLVCPPLRCDHPNILQVAAREAVRAAAEDALGLPCGLLVEFTGLICWRPGAVIGWHHDANRYLAGVMASAVVHWAASVSLLVLAQGAPPAAGAAPAWASQLRTPQERWQDGPLSPAPCLSSQALLAAARLLGCLLPQHRRLRLPGGHIPVPAGRQRRPGRGTLEGACRARKSGEAAQRPAYAKLACLPACPPTCSLSYPPACPPAHVGCAHAAGVICLCLVPCIPKFMSGLCVCVVSAVHPDRCRPALPACQVAYSSQEVHSITRVTAGERFTFTMWFTQDPAHCEDSRLLAQLAGGCCIQAARQARRRAAAFLALPGVLRACIVGAAVTPASSPVVAQVASLPPSLPPCGCYPMGLTCGSAAWPWLDWGWLAKDGCC